MLILLSHPKNIQKTTELECLRKVPNLSHDHSHEARLTVPGNDFKK